jgi:hypothetical protein
MGFHKVSAFHPFIFQKSGKSTIIRNLAVPCHFVAYISSIRVDPGPRNRGPTSLLALKIRTPVANTGKLRSIGQVPVHWLTGFRGKDFKTFFPIGSYVKTMFADGSHLGWRSGSPNTILKIDHMPCLL